MTDHDPGDESDGRDVRERCPFCGVDLRRVRVWVTPVCGPVTESFAEAMARTALSGWVERCEELRTCTDCSSTAERFAAEHSMPLARKVSRAYERWLDARLGLSPAARDRRPWKECPW